MAKVEEAVKVVVEEKAVKAVKVVDTEVGEVNLLI